MRTKREQATKNASVKDIYKFDPDNFYIHEDALLNIMLQTFGLQGERLRYIFHADVPPSIFVDKQEYNFYQLTLNGAKFEAYNSVVFCKLK